MASSAERKTAAPWRKFEKFEFVTFQCNYPPLSSAGNHCKQFAPRSGQIKPRVPNSLTLETLKTFQKTDFEKISRILKNMQNYTACREI